jgi:hypothetical protein
MPERAQVTAEMFRTAFLTSYSKVRGSFASDKRWKEMWGRPWKGLMLARLGETHLLPDEVKGSVLADAASRLGLRYPSERGNREPMTFDAIFSEPAKNDDPFPIRVAIEHEQDWKGFGNEIRKLLSVRCLLKVGITYTGDSPQGNEYRKKIAKWIDGDFNDIEPVVKEDPRTEYLFLAGAESDNFEVSWYSLEFNAQAGPQKRDFQPAILPNESAA